VLPFYTSVGSVSSQYLHYDLCMIDLFALAVCTDSHLQVLQTYALCDTVAVFGDTVKHYIFAAS